MENSSMEVIWAVRDARGLTSNEKTFLFVVASRGVMKATRATILEDCGFKKDTYYTVVKSLTDKGMIEAHTGTFNGKSQRQTHYTVVVEALRESATQTQVSATQTTMSATQTQVSVRPDTEGNKKETMKETKKVTDQESVSSEPASPLQSIDKGDEGSLFGKEQSSILVIEEDPSLAARRAERAALKDKALEGLDKEGRNMVFDFVNKRKMSWTEAREQTDLLLEVGTW